MKRVPTTGVVLALVLFGTLVAGLATSAQRATAMISGVAPNEIVTTNQPDIKPLSPEGIWASVMTPAQRETLMQVLDSFIGLMSSEVAADRMAKITAAGIGNIAFAWAGGVERGQKHYYRLQGPMRKVPSLRW